MKQIKSDQMVNNYNYSEDIRQWVKKHGHGIKYTCKIDIPGWMRISDKGGQNK